VKRQELRAFCLTCYLSAQRALPEPREETFPLHIVLKLNWLQYNTAGKDRALSIGGKDSNRSLFTPAAVGEAIGLTGTDKDATTHTG